jgi:hypothetical protein
MPLPLKLIVWILGLVITLRLVRFATTPLLRWLGYYTYRNETIRVAEVDKRAVGSN